MNVLFGVCHHRWGWVAFFQADCTGPVKTLCSRAGNSLEVRQLWRSALLRLKGKDYWIMLPNSNTNADPNELSILSISYRFGTIFVWHDRSSELNQIDWNICIIYILKRSKKPKIYFLIKYTEVIPGRFAINFIASTSQYRSAPSFAHKLADN